MKISLDSSRARTALVSFALALTVVSLILHLRWLGQGQDVGGIARVFNLDSENSMPTWWACAQLVGVSLLLLLRAGLAERRAERHLLSWVLLGAGFMLMSIDEATSLHERARHFVPDPAIARGPFRFAWVIPGIALVSTLAAVFSRFLLFLPRRRAIQFATAGAVYVGGCIVMEMVGGTIYTALGTRDALPYVLSVHLEELLEMLGVALFASALIEELSSAFGADDLTISFKGP
jgi:hypothetical protein